MTDDQIVTVVIPLLNARAVPVSEQLKNLVAGYGSVTPLEQQNAVVLVETAAQVQHSRRSSPRSTSRTSRTSWS